MDRSQSSTVLCLLVSAWAICIYGVAADECTDAINIGNIKRSAWYILGQYEEPLSDIGIDPNPWYRFESPTGNKIPEHEVLSYHCSTNSPIWVNATHPTADQVGPVPLKVCAQLRCDGDVCGWTSTVQAKWCSDATTGKEFFAYKLTPPPREGMAYCGGFKTNCGVDCTQNEQTSECICPPQPPMTPPILSQAFISITKTIIDPSKREYVASKFSINCTIGYPRQELDDGARFLVSFEANEVQFVKFVISSTDSFITLDESYLNGHIGTTITAKVFPYWKKNDPDLSVFQVSNGVWFGVKPRDEFGVEVTSPVILKEGEVFRYRMVANFPITAPACFNTLLDVACTPSYKFKIIATGDGLVDSCAFLLTPNSNSSSDFIIIMPRPSIGKRIANFIWKITFEKITENTIFYDYEIAPIVVQIEDQVERPACQAVGDPHLITFQHEIPPTRPRNYHVYTTGDYYLVKATNRLFEIQVRQFVCSPPRTCLCSVMVREGNNIVGIDACRSSDTPLPSNFNPRFVRLLVDKAYPSLSIKATSEKSWTIITISGVEITVNKEISIPGTVYLDVFVRALNTDNYTGLCSFNVPNEYFVCAAECDEYTKANAVCSSECDQYRVPDGESMFNYTETIVPTCFESYSLPTCDCTPQEGDKYCNATNYHPDQSNLLRSSRVCDGSTQRQMITEDTIEWSLLIQVNITLSHSRSNVALFWPTPKNAITEEQATAQCNSVLASSNYQSICGARSDIDTKALITSCVMDIQAGDDLQIANAVTSQFQTSCEYSIKSSKVETNDPKDSQIEDIHKQFEEILKKSCPSLCHNKGKCNNDDGTCTCDPGFSGRSCGLVDGQVPKIMFLVFDTCDLRNRSCNQIHVKAIDFSQTETLSCQLNSTVDGIQYDTSPMANQDMIICSLPSKPNVDIYQVSISNDGKVYSPPATFTVFRSNPDMPDASDTLTLVPTTGPPARR